MPAIIAVAQSADKQRNVGKSWWASAFYLYSHAVGATIVRFDMRCQPQKSAHFFLLALCLLAPDRLAAHPQSVFTEASLPVFELHSGFWINLHHTLYHEARLRPASSSREATADKASPP